MISKNTIFQKKNIHIFFYKNNKNATNCIYIYIKAKYWTNKRETDRQKIIHNLDYNKAVNSQINKHGTKDKQKVCNIKQLQFFIRGRRHYI